MARTSVRRPIPAIIFILALSLLTALVWVRVLHRGDGDNASGTTPSPTCVTSTAPATLPKPSQVRVTVLNSTDREGIAASATASFKARGFLTGTAGNDPNPVSGFAEVRYGPKLAAAARLVQTYLPGSTLVATQSSSTAITVSLGAKYTAVATASAAAQRQKSPTVRTCK